MRSAKWMLTAGIILWLVAVAVALLVHISGSHLVHRQQQVQDLHHVAWHAADAALLKEQNSTRRFLLVIWGHQHGSNT